MRHTLRLACPATLTRPSASKTIPFEPGSGPLNGSVPAYPLGCMKTLAPLPGTHRSMLFAGISPNKRVPSCVQTGPSVHLLKPVAIRSSLESGPTNCSRVGSSFCMSCANADMVKAMTLTIKRKSRCIPLDVMVRRKPQRTRNVFMFPLRDLVAASSYQPTDIHTLAGERHFFQCSTEGPPRRPLQRTYQSKRIGV